MSDESGIEFPEQISLGAGGSEHRTNTGPGGRERLQTASGYAVMIDQFMLGNDQLLALLHASCPHMEDVGAVEKELSSVVQRYGGSLIKLSPGSFTVFRDPQRMLIALAKERSSESDSSVDLDHEFEEIIERVASARDRANPLGQVYVDTRCLVMIDAGLLGDRKLIAEYKLLRRNGQEKEARDLLRERGAAVRYGFQRHGDEFGVFCLAEGELFALWPDVVD